MRLVEGNEAQRNSKTLTSLPFWTFSSERRHRFSSHKSSTPNSFFLPFFSSTPYNCHRLPGQNNYTEFFKTPYTLQKTSINMKFFSQLLVLGLAAEATVASSWFSKSGMFTFRLSNSLEPSRGPHHIFELQRVLRSFMQSSFLLLEF